MGRKKGAKERDMYDRILDAFGNQTKMAMLLLLSRRDRLTVTQMARHIKVTRANLYHCAGDMVRDGLLAEPEVVVKKNHIEKYYSINSSFWKEVDPAAQDRRVVESMGLEGGRKVLRSALLSLSLQFRILADEVDGASDEELTRIGEEYEKKRMMLSVWSVEDDVYEMVVARMHSLLEEVVEEGNRRPSAREKEKNSVYITCLPAVFSSIGLSGDEEADGSGGE